MEGTPANGTVSQQEGCCHCLLCCKFPGWFQGSPLDKRHVLLRMAVLLPSLVTAEQRIFRKKTAFCSQGMAAAEKGCGLNRSESESQDWTEKIISFPRDMRCCSLSCL